MTPATVDELTTSFAIPGHVTFLLGPGSLPLIVARGPHAQATIALQGATILSFQPEGHEDVLWVSSHSTYTQDRPIRGGIPICWPWFGPHPTDPTGPAHGFVRGRPWTVLGAAVRGDGATEVRLGLHDGEETRSLWPHPFALELVVTVGTELRVSLRVRNTGSEPFTCGGALHTYLRVGEVTAVTIHGLEGCSYIDQVDGRIPKVQLDAITIAEETDRVYQQTAGPVTVEDPGLGRHVTVGKAGSRSTVVWNPWREKARRLDDMGDDEYLQMVCVEVANACDDSVVVSPGGEHHLETTIAVGRAAP